MIIENVTEEEMEKEFGKKHHHEYSGDEETGKLLEGCDYHSFFKDYMNLNRIYLCLIYLMD
jgi:hypothetical protein